MLKICKDFHLYINSFISVKSQKKFNRYFLSGWQPAQKPILCLDHKSAVLYVKIKPSTSCQSLKKKKPN